MFRYMTLQSFYQNIQVETIFCCKMLVQTPHKHLMILVRYYIYIINLRTNLGKNTQKWNILCESDVKKSQIAEIV